MLYHQQGSIRLCLFASTLPNQSHLHHTLNYHRSLKLELDLLYFRHYLLTSCALPCHQHLYRARYSSTSTGKGNTALKSFLLIIQFSIELTRKLHSVSNRNLLSPEDPSTVLYVCISFHKMK